MNKKANTADSGICRRKFLEISALSAAGLAASTGGGQAYAAAKEYKSAERKDKRPNILVITTDQQWAEAMSCRANPYLNTPAIDSIARDGVQFESAYSANPICVPSRSSYMTGLTPHEVGVTHNLSAEDTDFTAPCLGRLFQNAGYETGYVGKWHVPRNIHETSWSGFDYLAEIKDNEVDFLIPAPASEFITKDRDKPFLLFASFVNPHDICEWARIASDIDDHLKNGEIGEVPPPQQCPPMRANCQIPDYEPPAIREHQQFEGLSGQYPTRNWSNDDGRWRQYLWAYYRMVEKVDDYIGKILETLRAAGEEENTLIIFTSDHGDGIGSHRWNQKSLFYDEVAKIPFIVSWKGKTVAGGRNKDRLVNLGLDLLPTMLEAAGITKPSYAKGLSTLQTAMGKDDPAEHKYIVSENNLHEGWAKPGEVNGRMVRSRRYKYTIYSKTNPAEQLFDMLLDPGETRDLAGKREFADILQDHRRMLKEYMTKTNDSFSEQVEI